MKKVFINGGGPRPGLEELSEKYEVIFPPRGGFAPGELEAILPEVDAILAMGTVTRAQIELAKKAQLICCFGAGYDRIDMEAANEYKIPVCNIPQATARPTAELTVSIMLACARRIAELDKLSRADTPVNAGAYLGTTLGGLQLGIVGVGHIGSYVASICRALGMKIAYYDIAPVPEERIGQAQFMPFDELIATSDVITIHCPYNEHTANMFNKDVFAKMKTSAILVNAARGGIVDYDALTQALQTGAIQGAALDVFPNEPHIPEALKTLDNVVLTPHVGTNTTQSRIDMCKACADAIVIALEGNRPPNIVNPWVVE